MPRLRTLLNPSAYVQTVRRWLRNGVLSRNPNAAGVLLYPPGHFYSPLLNIASFGTEGGDLSFDGAAYWECVGLDASRQRAFYGELLGVLPTPSFPSRKTEGHRYYSDNGMFCFADAFTLAAIIRMQRPRRIVEAGSGFSSAVMLDTRDAIDLSVDLTFIEPYPTRLYSLLSAGDRSAATIHEKRVQEVPLTVYDELVAGDILFIDSSHVAKVGSDVTFLLLRVLPRLRAGVLVHVHDIFYPESYPASWIRQGRSWNESIVLRAFLAGNSGYEVIAFNAFAAVAFPDLFETKLPAFLVNQRSGDLDMGAGGASIWLRKRPDAAGQ